MAPCQRTPSPAPSGPPAHLEPRFLLALMWLEGGSGWLRPAFLHSELCLLPSLLGGFGVVCKWLLLWAVHLRSLSGMLTLLVLIWSPQTGNSRDRKSAA